MPALYQAIGDAQNKTRQFLILQGLTEDEMSINPVSVTDNQSVSYNQNQDMPRYSADTGLTISTSHIEKVAAAVSLSKRLNTVSKLYPYLWPNDWKIKFRLIIAIFLLFGSMALNVGVPLILRQVIDVISSPPFAFWPFFADYFL